MKKSPITSIINTYKIFSKFNKNLNKWMVVQTIILLLSRTTVALFSLSLSNFVNKINHVTMFESVTIGVVSFYTINRMFEWFFSAIHGRLHTQFILPSALKFIDEIIFLMLKNYHKIEVSKSPVELSHLLNKKTEARGFLGYLFHHISMPLFELVICAILIVKLGFGWLGYLLVPVCIVHLLISISLIPKLKNKMLKLLSLNARTTSMFANSLGKANLANTFGTTQVLIEELRKQTENETKEFKKSALLNDLFATLLNLPLALFACMFFYFGSIRVETGLATYGGFAAFISIVMNSFSQLKNLSFAFDGLNQSLSVLQLHLDLYEKMSSIVKAEEDNLIFESLNLENFMPIVSGNELMKISLELKNKDNLFIVGKSGIGKTSLINAILGYLPYNGQITVNKNEKIQRYKLFSWMPQEFQAIEGTIRFNLILGNNNATDEQMWQVLKKVNLEEKVKSLGGLDSNIKHNGSNLSGGENQRLSLARSILSNNPILVLDEPSSAIDMNLEKELFKQIVELNKTSIIVVHRLKAIPKNAKILFIKNKDQYIVDSLENLIENEKEFQQLYFSHDTV